MNIFATYELSELLAVAIVVFLLGMSKGGLPISTIALPILVLFWHGDIEPAKNAVAFILPLLCVMDIVALCFYRKHILWKQIIMLFPGSVAGVLVGSVLFVSQKKSLITVPDNGIKLLLGVVGLSFVLFQLAKKIIFRKLDHVKKPAWMASSVFGFSAGIVSTLAHAAGPVLSMYLLPRKLPKMNFAASRAAYFFFLNLVKVVPFALCGRIDSTKLTLGLWMLPVIPIGVAAGYLIVRKMKSNHYIAVIYAILAVTSATLIWKSFG